MIRTLRSGEVPPTGIEPRRYKNAEGYVRLRWRCPDGSFIECYEHRWVMRCFDPALHVHHINGIKDDNRPANLRLVTPSEHRVEHRTIDRQEARRLYVDEGMSTVAVAEEMGFTPPAIYRVLRDMGVRMRGLSEAQRYGDDELPLDQVRLLHDAGVRSRRIARLYGVSASLVDARVREMGLPPHRPGRPTNAEIATAMDALRAVIA